MASTGNFTAKTVFMTQGCTHVRVGSSAEFKIAAGGHFIMDYEQSTGKSYTFSNRGIGIIVTTAQNSSFRIRAPYRGAMKRFHFRSKAATSGGFRMRTTGKTIKMAPKTSCRNFMGSSIGKVAPLVGGTVTLYGLTTAQWLIIDRWTTGPSLLYTSSTGT